MPNQHAMLAAIDLGSNSFRMVIARVVGEELQQVDQLREGVRLAGYLDAKQRLRKKGQERAVACLEKFGQRLRDLPQESVRAVGTNTLRKAKDGGDFLQRAGAALGHKIEVISGQEEARLIFLGVAHSLAAGVASRLVVDIGGGSTECGLGEGYEPRLAESLYMGCVGYTLEHFPKGKIKPSYLRRAELAARLELEAIRSPFRQFGWETCAGSSGTIQAIGEVLRQNGWSAGGIDRQGLRKLKKALLAARHVDELTIKGLRGERAKVLPGGLAILLAVFESFGIEQMQVSQGALREGVLYDLLGRFRREDIRDLTIQSFVQRFDVDLEQARRVEQTALLCLGQAAAGWGLDLQVARPLLTWAASLLEVGLAIAHAGYQKHSAYLVGHSHMPGFSIADQRLLSVLVRCHRRKLDKGQFQELFPEREDLAMKLVLLLRIAFLLHRSRSRRPSPDFRLVAESGSLRLFFPEDWLQLHPLTSEDFDREAAYLRAVDIELSVGKL
jgi:exopolyphosphatase/guanosine-5'-triphosphate,3'-diphosphate pyrophosphatase